jgi:predicted acetyltransferase
VSDATDEVRVDAADVSERDVLARLLELYAHDFSERTGADVDDDGTFGWHDLHRYWREPDRHPFLFRVDGRLAGFALVRSGAPHDMAEFFVLRKYRRSQVGTEAARAVFVRFPGEWQTREQFENTGAIAFWRHAIPVSFDETSNEEGPVQRFVMPTSGPPRIGFAH